MKHVLFVCSGNTCRSPLAEGIAQRLLEERGEVGVTVASAGTSTLDGLPASTHSTEVAARRGIDISGHRARLLNAALVRSADLIVTMGDKHRDTVSVIDPDAAAYTVLLTDLSPEYGGDVPDPIGAGLGMYDEVYSLISACVSQLVADLKTFDGWKPSALSDT